MSDAEIPQLPPEETGISQFNNDIYRVRGSHSQVLQQHPEYILHTPNIQAFSIRSPLLRGHTIHGEPIRGSASRYSAIDFPSPKLATHWKAFKLLAIRSQGIDELIKGMDNGTLKLPKVFVVATEAGLASNFRTWGFNIPDQYAEKVKPETPHERILMVGHYEEIKSKFAEFKQSDTYRRIMEEASVGSK